MICLLCVINFPYLNKFPPRADINHPAPTLTHPCSISMRPPNTNNNVQLENKCIKLTWRIEPVNQRCGWSFKREPRRAPQVIKYVVSKFPPFIVHQWCFFGNIHFKITFGPIWEVSPLGAKHCIAMYESLIINASYCPIWMQNTTKRSTNKVRVNRAECWPRSAKVKERHILSPI